MQHKVDQPSCHVCCPAYTSDASLQLLQGSRQHLDQTLMICHQMAKEFTSLPMCTHAIDNIHASQGPKSSALLRKDTFTAWYTVPVEGLMHKWAPHSAQHDRHQQTCAARLLLLPKNQTYSVPELP